VMATTTLRSGLLQFGVVEVAALEKLQRYFVNPRLAPIEFEFLPALRNRTARAHLWFVSARLRLRSNDNQCSALGACDARGWRLSFARAFASRNTTSNLPTSSIGGQVAASKRKLRRSRQGQTRILAPIGNWEQDVGGITRGELASEELRELESTEVAKYTKMYDAIKDLP
jgi:hypothetical protein